MKQRSYNKNKNNSAKHIAILLGICMLSGALTGCGFVANPMQYMKDADEELVAAEQNTDDGTSGNSSAGTSGDNSSEAMQVTDNKIIVIGTYGSISDMINTDDYKSQADIECIQETRDFDDTSDMLAVVKKVQESCDTDAESVIVSVRSRIYKQISYLLQHTINTSKGLLVIREDAKDTDYNTTFAEALNVAVEPETYNAGVTQTTTSGNSTVNSAGVSDITTNNSSNNYTVISRLTDMDVFDVSQLVKDTAESIPVVILCNGGYNAAAMAQEEYGSCIAASGMSAEQARIMAMLCLTQSKSMDDWKVHFTQTGL